MGTSFHMTRTQIEPILKDMNCDWIFQKERCPDTHREHYHIGIRFSNPRGIAFQATWPKTVHWEKARRWPATRDYCCKRSTRLEGPWTNIEGMKFRRTIRDPMEGLTPYDWQQAILDLIKTIPDDRIVYWYWEPRGCTGKSYLAKHIRMWYKCIVANGKASDIYCALKAKDEDSDIDVAIFDLSRSQRDRVSYEAIENIKNGMFFCGKYESSDCLMNPPHVIVFANFRPELDMLSENRWRIVEIGS